MKRFFTMAALLACLLTFPASRWAPGVAPAKAQYDQSGTANPSGGEAERDAGAEKRKTRSRFQYLMLGYGLIWVSLGYYLFDLNRRVAHVGRDIDELKGRLDLAEGRRGR